MNRKSNEFRENLANEFLKILEESPKEWHKGWNFGLAPVNLISNKKYKGINLLSLGLKQQARDGADPRWATFKQIQNKGLKLKQGSKGAKVEYYMPYDKEARKILKWQDYNKAIERGRDIKEFSLISKYFTVFNGEDIEGLEPYKKYENKSVKAEELTERIQKALDVEIINVEQDRAYYNQKLDVIKMPLESQFESSYEYNSTLMHELTHCTGAAHRLNRNMQGSFGSKEYAYEELIAEITTCYMSEYMENVMSEQNFENHKAYISSWIANIKEDKNFLFRAIKEAEKTAEYIVKEAELGLFLEQKQMQKEIEDKLLAHREKGLKIDMSKMDTVTASEYLNAIEAGLSYEMVSYMQSKDLMAHEIKEAAESMILESSKDLDVLEINDNKDYNIDDFKEIGFEEIDIDMEKGL